MLENKATFQEPPKEHLTKKQNTEIKFRKQTFYIFYVILLFISRVEQRNFERRAVILKQKG